MSSWRSLTPSSRCTWRFTRNLPSGKPQVRDRHLKFHEDRDNLAGWPLMRLFCGSIPRDLPTRAHFVPACGSSAFEVRGWQLTSGNQPGGRKGRLAGGPARRAGQSQPRPPSRPSGSGHERHCQDNALRCRVPFPPKFCTVLDQAGRVNAGSRRYRWVRPRDQALGHVSHRGRLPDHRLLRHGGRPSRPSHIDWDLSATEKGRYEYAILKELKEIAEHRPRWPTRCRATSATAA